MGLIADIASQVLVTMKVDTSDMKSGLKELSGIERDQRKELIETAEARNRQYDSWKKQLGEINQSLELVNKVVAFAKDAFKAYAEDLRIRAAAGAVNIDRLREASMGLRTEHELLAFAAKTSNGIIRASEGDMAIAQRAMVSLTRAGFDQEEVSKKITDAMVKLETDGLKDLGIGLEKGKTPLETYSNLMAELGKRASGVKDGTTGAAEGIQKTSVTMSESMDKMKIALGQLVASMAPLLDALARAVGYVADLAKGHLDVQAAGGQQAYLQQMVAKAQGKVIGKDGVWRSADEARSLDVFENFASAGNYQAALNQKIFGGFAAAGNYDAAQAQSLASVAQLESIAAGIGGGVISALQGTAGAGGKIGKADFGKALSDSEIKSRALTAARMQAEAMLHGATTEGNQAVAGVASKSLGAAASYGVDKFGVANENDIFKKTLGIDPETLTSEWQKRLEASRAEKSSFLESTFGKIEEFNAYHEAFSMLTGGVTTAMDAWITGSMSAGQAVKKFIADSLKALASQMAVEALKHGAYAIGSAAFGDFGGAARHAQAAVAFGAAAVAAGVAAKSMHSSGGGSSSTSSGSGSGQSYGGGSGKGDDQRGKDERPIYVIVGSSYEEMTPRARLVASRESVDKALRERDEQ